MLSATLSRMENAVDRIATNRPVSCITIFTALLIIWCLQISQALPLWMDEIFTYRVAQLPTLADLWKVSGIYDQPPLGYLLTRWSQALLGANEFGTRFPSVAGTAVMSASMFLIARRRCGGLCALSALCFPAATSAMEHANDARPYSLLLGIAALSVYFWHLATTNRRRVGLVGLAICIHAGLWTHYYASIQVVLPLVFGELVRTLRSWRVDWGVWGVFTTGLASLAVLVPMALKSAGILSEYVLNSPVFWAKPSLLNVVDFFPTLLTGSLFPVLLALGFAALWKPNREVELANKGLAFHELACAFGFLFMPLLLTLFTRWRTGYFADRYAVTALVGVVLILVSLLAHGTRGRRAALAMVPLLLTVPFARSLKLNRVVAATSKVKAEMLPPGTLPVVVANALEFVARAHYGTPELLARIVYLSDPSYAVQQADFIPELSLLRDPGLIPGTVEDYRAFINKHPKFWVVADGMFRLEWTIPRLAKDGFELNFYRQNGARVWYRVERPDWSAAVRH